MVKLSDFDLKVNEFQFSRDITFTFALKPL